VEQAGSIWSNGRTQTSRVLLRRVMSQWHEQVRPIPQVVHQTWRECGLAPVHAAWRGRCIRMMLNFTWLLWTDANNRQLVEEHFSDLLPLFDAFDVGIKRVDAARYLYLYLFGGIYMDLDVTCLRPLTKLPLTAGKAIFAFQYNVTSLHTNKSSTNPDERRHDQVANAFMAAPPAHPFIAHVISLMVQRSRGLLQRPTPEAHNAGRTIFGTDNGSKSNGGAGKGNSSSRGDGGVVNSDHSGGAAAASGGSSGSAVDTGSKNARISAIDATGPSLLSHALRTWPKGDVQVLPLARVYGSRPYDRSHGGRARCGKGAEEELQACAVAHPESVTTTFWTHSKTWQRHLAS
jgi:hypothetical protein